MVSVTLSLIAFLTLIVWRFVFADLQRRPSPRETAAPQRRNNGFRALQAVAAAMAGNRFGNLSPGVGVLTREERARIYLRSIVALTGARQTGNSYVLEVGTIRFHVCDRYVGRLKDVSDPKSAYEETCFCLPYKDMPRKEQIASVLLHLRSNPALFDRWAAQDGAYKANGQGFAPPR